MLPNRKSAATQIGVEKLFGTKVKEEESLGSGNFAESFSCDADLSALAALEDFRKELRAAQKDFKNSVFKFCSQNMDQKIW